LNVEQKQRNHGVVTEASTPVKVINQAVAGPPGKKPWIGWLKPGKPGISAILCGSMLAVLGAELERRKKNRETKQIPKS